MKQPLFNQDERQLIIEDDSYFASRAKLHIAVKKLERDIANTRVFKKIEKFFLNIAQKLNHLINQFNL